MSAIEKLRKQFKKTTQRESELWLEEIPAWMGNKDGEVTTGIAGMVYVRTVEGQLLEVFNNTAPAEYNLLIKIGRRKDQPDLWQVIGRREVWDVPGTSSVVHHHEQHEFMQPDMVMLDRRQISQLSVLVKDAAAFTVQVIGAFVHTANGIAEISSQVVDLSSYMPELGALFVNIESDDDGMLSVNEGDNFGSPILAAVSHIPVPDPGKYMIATVLLYEGQATLLNEYIRVPMPLGLVAKSYGLQINDAAADTPLDADLLGFWDVVDGILKKITWANFKATLKTYFDTLYATPDSSVVTYTPADATDWNGDTDPGNVDDALDQLADRMVVAESGIGQYRQFAWVDDGSGGWEFITAGGEPVLHLQDLE